MKSTKHCNEIEKKCNRVLGCIKRQFLFKNKKIVITLYNALILPPPSILHSILVTGTIVKDIDRLGRVQATATKRFQNLNTYHMQKDWKN